VWDVFAILTYLTVSATFFYVGLVPDIAVLRDQEKNPIRKRIFSALALGWRNSDREWRHFTRAYLFLAAFATPLVLSVHSVVSFDFAMALTPGWHATIFPPYFVAGAIFSGIGMVFTILIPLRKLFKLEHIITINDLDAAAKLCLFTSMVVGLAYLTSSRSRGCRATRWSRSTSGIASSGSGGGPRGSCSSATWCSHSRSSRSSFAVTHLALLLLDLRQHRMWFERFVIVVPSLSHEFEPWQWGGYRPTWVDYCILLGSFGWFFMWFLLFIRQLP
jgi:molybdopterin-containing oxidoreductase family membrane subunit